MPIEQVQVGDCVLAQNPDTGELDYKAVLATTTRTTSRVIAVRTAKETIRATRGHPFWVSGIGWQMAKELKAGQLLHTPDGPLPLRLPSQTARRNATTWSWPISTATSLAEPASGPRLQPAASDRGHGAWAGCQVADITEMTRFLLPILSQRAQSIAAPEREHRKEEDGSCVGITSVSASVLSFVSLLPLAALAATPAVSSNSSPGDLVQAALVAEVQGDANAARTCSPRHWRLTRTLPARWQSGYVQWKGEWLSLDDVAQRAAATRTWRAIASCATRWSIAPTITGRLPAGA